MEDNIMTKTLYFALLGLCVFFLGATYCQLKVLNHSLKVKQQRQQLQQALGENQEQLAFQSKLLSQVFGYVPSNSFSTPVTVTAYSARPQETNSEPWFTADMTPSRVGLLAVSRDLLYEIGLQYGQTVILEGLGVFKVRDTMNERFRRRVDILMAHHKAAKLFGKREAVLRWVN
jgi:3D (Asp-Asp-Asp) domain-containing protein